MDGSSLFAPLRGGNPTRDGSPLLALARGVIEREDPGCWDIELDDMWCSIRPSGHHMRDQGWKLHVAATRSSATEVLRRALGVLVRHRCAFKFASTLDDVAVLNSRNYSRGGAGKFLTVYPESDEQFRWLAEELDTATAGLPGPRILSDRPYRAGSLVHYRYGGFAGGMVLSNDSDYRLMLQGPDGSLVEDRRDAWFSPPEWAPSPLGEPEVVRAGTGAAPQVLLAGRFVVREAIRHANKGGVYRATDTRTGADVVIKEARAYVEVDEDERDVRDSMRNEAEMLDVLAPLGVAPRKLELFEQGGNLFLAEDLVPGTSLRRWVSEQIEHTNGGPGLPWPVVVPLVRQLVALLAVVHAAGVVLRDLTPNNVMVVPDGRLRLVDLELAAPPGSRAQAAGTPGYAAPEQLAGAAAAREADLFSLGAVIFTLATGAAPLLLDDEPPTRSLQARLEQCLDIVAGCSQAASRLKPLILGLMGATPDERWELGRVAGFLDAAEQSLTPTAEQSLTPTTPRAEEPEPAGRRLAPDDQERLVGDGVQYLLGTMNPEQGRLWPSSCFGVSSDPCNVHHGAAGVLAVLTRAAQLEGRGGSGGAAPGGRDRVRDALRIACEWIERRLPQEPRLLPGLYFGRSGTAWALFDAARVLGDEPMAERALGFAKRIPITWPNPDLTHGVAGAGLAQLYLWQATGDAEFRRRAQRCADHLVVEAERRATGVSWTTPAWFDSRFAGSRYYGFAHGVAGIAWFLLAAGLAMDRDDCRELARAAGETLCATAQRDRGGATWGEGPGDDTGRWVYWCHGSSGVGTFLIRLWQATGDERFRGLAELAARAVWRTRWYVSSSICHGLAGGGEFFLDLAAALDEPRYQAWAEELAAILFARHAHREGRTVIPDDTGTGLAADYGVGLAGVIAFLLRLRHGGPRLWMADLESSPATVGR